MTTPAPNAASNPTSTANSTENLPGANTLLQSAKLAIEQDKAIMLDYYRETAAGTHARNSSPDTARHRTP